MCTFSQGRGAFRLRYLNENLFATRTKTLFVTRNPAVRIVVGPSYPSGDPSYPSGDPSYPSGDPSYPSSSVTRSVTSVYGATSYVTSVYDGLRYERYASDNGELTGPQNACFWWVSGYMSRSILLVRSFRFDSINRRRFSRNFQLFDFHVDAEHGTLFSITL